MASEDTQILDASLNKIQETLAKAGEDKSPAEIAKLANLTAAAEQRKVQADAKQEARDLAQKAREEATAQKWDNLLGHFTWARKFQERTAKAAKAAQSSVIDFGKEKIKSVQNFAGNLMDTLKKGLGLAAIWALFKFLEGDGAQMFWDVYHFVEGIIDWFVLLFTDPLAAMKQLWNGMMSGAKSIGMWIWNNTFVKLWDWFEETFPGAASVIKKLWAGLTGLAGNIGTWFYENAIKPVWEWLKLLWDDPMAALEQLATGVMNLGTWLWENAIKPFWEWVKLLFTDPKAAMAQFLEGYLSVGKWIYDKAIKPLWDWFEEQFPDAAAWIKAKWAEFMATPIGEWLYDTILKPFTEWLELAFTDPTAAIDAAWTFFKSFDVWIMDKVLKPFWNWFKGMFPDVAVALEKFWAEFTGGGDTIIGKIGTFLSGIWDWFKGMFVFDDIGTAIASLLNFVFLPHNLIVKMVSSVWDYIKGIFGFKPDEAKLDENFSIGKWLTDGLLKPVIDWLKGLLDMDFAKLAKSMMPAKLYDWIFGGDVESMGKEDLEARAKELEGIIDEGTGMTNWSIEDEKAELEKVKARLAKMALGGTMVSGGAAIVGEKGPEIVVSTRPAKVIPAQESAALLNGGGGQSVVSAPTNTVINNSGSTSMMMGSSSEDKSNWKYGMQGA